MLISLGSNLGDRLENLRLAKLHMEEAFGAVLAESSVYETAPWGNLNQPNFYNSVLSFHKKENPFDVLETLLAIEHQMGRVRRERWGIRLIDLDLLFLGDAVLDDGRMELPHPRLHLRRFVLAPLCEIAPDFVHPVLEKTLSELLFSCLDTSEVKKVGI